MGALTESSQKCPKWALAKEGDPMEYPESRP